MENGVFLGGPTNNLTDLELRIKEVAAELDIRMSDLAERAGVNPSYLSRIASNNVSPSLKLLQQIAEAMHVPIHRLIVAPKGYGHFYVDGEWHGLRKK